MKRILSVLICCCMIIGLTGGIAFAESADMEWKLDTSPVTLSAFINFPQGTFKGWGQDPVTTEIINRTGVTIDLRTASTSDNEELNLMLSSGDLPDYIIINAGSAMRQVLWEQEFAQPLNKLMDEYAPNMRSVLGEFQESIYTESDGNFYMMVDYFSDTNKIAQLEGVFKFYPPLAMNRYMYEELGSPSIETIDEFRDLLMKVKEKYPDLPYINIDATITNPMEVRNMAYIFYRMFGGENMKAIGEDGNVRLGLRDPEYLEAVKFISGLYRDGLFNKENFTLNGEQFEEAIKNQQVFAYWGQAYNCYRYDMTETAPYLPYALPKINDITPKLDSLITSVGGWHGVHVSSTTEHSDRAIRYLEFMQSDEGQYLMNFGIEGEHYEMADGMPRRIGEAKEIAATDWGSFTEDFGLYNYNIQWLASTWTDSLEYFWASEDNYAYQVELALPDYSNDERMNNLIILPTDSEEAIIETKIRELWSATLPKLYLAESEEDLEDAYNELVSQAEAMGLADLEAAYTANYHYWLEKLG